MDIKTLAKQKRVLELEVKNLAEAKLEIEKDMQLVTGKIAGMEKEVKELGNRMVEQARYKREKERVREEGKRFEIEERRKKEVEVQREKLMEEIWELTEFKRHIIRLREDREQGRWTNKR